MTTIDDVECPARSPAGRKGMADNFGLRGAANDKWVRVILNFDPGGERGDFILYLIFEGKVGEKIKWTAPQIGRAGAGGHFIFFNGVLFGGFVDVAFIARFLKYRPVGQFCEILKYRPVGQFCEIFEIPTS